MLLEELLRCQIQEWYPLFRRHTVPTVTIPLPAAFLRYLTGQPAHPGPSSPHQDAEGPPPFLLPALTSGRTPFPPLHLPDHDDSSDLFSGCSDDECDESPPLPAFHELEAAVDAAIAELGAAALPKLNWSAPKDAAFMSADGTVRCTCFAEVAMLLRSSDCVAHDLASECQSCQDFVRAKGARRNAGQCSGANKAGAPLNAGGSTSGAGSPCDPSDDCNERGRQAAAVSDDSPEDDVGQESGDDAWVDDEFQCYLALRKWHPGLRPESEFRCFVRGWKLVGVSQRDTSAYYPSLPGWSAEVQLKIEDFFEEVIASQFASENYTFDVYVRADGQVKLIDFNPWGGYTLPLMFTWEELEDEQRGED